MKKIIGFLKIAKTEYIEDLVLYGNLYFSLAESFRDKNQYDVEKLDLFEGALSEHGKILIDIGSERKPHFVDSRSSGKITIKGNECIYCIRSIYEDNLEYISQNRIAIHLHPGFIPGIIGNDEWSNYSFLFIRDSIGFLDVVESAAKKIGVPYKFAPVCYDDHLYDILHPLFSDAYAIEAYMHKNCFPYQNQQEYRFLVQNTEHRDIVINIGTNFFQPGNFIWGKDLSKIHYVL